VAADSVLALAAASMSGAAISSSEGSATRSPAFRLRDAIGCDRGGSVYWAAIKTRAAYRFSGLGRGGAAAGAVEPSDGV
jgi:hypothetical protein